MATILLKDNRQEFLTTDQDLFHVIRNYMGDDVAEWTEEYIKDTKMGLMRAKEDLDDKIQDQKDELDDYQCAIKEVRHELAELEGEVRDKECKIDRTEILKYIHNIEDIFDNYRIG